MSEQNEVKEVNKDLKSLYQQLEEIVTIQTRTHDNLTFTVSGKASETPVSNEGKDVGNITLSMMSHTIAEVRRTAAAIENLTNTLLGR